MIAALISMQLGTYNDHSLSGGGGGSGPTPTPDPYTWIEDLPLYGQTPEVVSVWDDPFTVLLNMYGVVRDEGNVIDPSTMTLSLPSVFLQLSVESQNAWQWSGFSIWDTIYSQQTILKGITIDLSCPTTIATTPGYDTIFGCNNFSPIVASGMNATAHFQPDVEIGGEVQPVGNYYIDFAHKLSP